MSLRLFVYLCMVCGAYAGFIGWGLGHLIVKISNDTPLQYIMGNSLKGMFLGLSVAIGLSFLDAIFNLSLSQLGKVFLRVGAALIVGVIGSFLGSMIGSALYFYSQGALGGIAAVLHIVGWTLVGFLIGLSICFFEVVVSMVTRKNFMGSLKKFIKCALGGTVGGALGGIVALVVAQMLLFITRLITSKTDDELLSPTAIGFVALGACIGLLIGLAQVILKEAWVRVEAGFRPGRELILSKERTVIGRGEGSDIALFGDMAVEKAHAHIVLEAGRYYLEDMQTPSGSFVNDQKITGRAPLKAGDLIRVGNSVLLFNERVKRKD